MDLFLHSMVETLVLVTALSVDAFVASFAYGANRIRIPFASVAVITLICSATLAVSLLFGSILQPVMPPNLTHTLCFCILFILGMIKLFDSSIKSWIRRHKKMRRQFHFSIFHMRFILNVYADPQKADRDASKLLSPAEAASLAFALSLDGLAVGFGAALASVHFLQAVLCSLVIGGAAVVLGSLVGEKIARRINLDLSWLSGLMLMGLAFLKLW